MIIQSKFHDYYDGLANTYRDEKIVYNRTTKEIDVREYLESYQSSDLKQMLNFVFEISAVFKAQQKREVVNVLLIGGKVYPFSEITSVDKITYEERITRNFKDPYKNYDKNAPRWFINRTTRYVDKIGQRILNATRLCEKLAPVILLTNDKYRKIVLNPCLKDYHPPVDPYTCFQDIMSVLASREPHIPEIDNETKIESAGFDRKISFRHRKK